MRGYAGHQKAACYIAPKCSCMPEVECWCGTIDSFGSTDSVIGATIRCVCGTAYRNAAKRYIS